mmetsp:Transcript_5009/g.7428  ORF Transcript_5009/g.7428 Transcript_5009/m.7428 type:complete len:190 (+) Transcript_5009:29-598(+)
MKRINLFNNVLRNYGRPKVFFDVNISGKNAGRMVMELHNDLEPKTAENFRQLCTGEAGTTSNGTPLHYKGAPFHRILKGFMAQGGDFTNRNGTGGESIYGETFEDGNMTTGHTKRGLLSMANTGRPKSNGSQFFITFVPVPYLDGRHTVFGEVVDGFEVLDALENEGSNNEQLLSHIHIEDCGEIEESH